MELLEEISSAILNSDITPTIGTTVTIRGIGGIGKSTIAKALCHDPLIKEHFINGFLWISLTPPLPNPMTMLSEIYQRLTGSSVTFNTSIIKSEIKSLVSSQSCKLLVVLDDVWETKDAMMFVDVFSSCRIIMTTRKMNINAKIPPMVCFDIKPMSIDEAVKLLTLQIINVQTLHASEINKIKDLARDLHCWPLLLNLVHGQLYVHCIEWNESPQDAILKVQQKLFDNGLTAFDPEGQLEASRENAVRASITASLELLVKDEIIVLFCIALSIAGFGVYTVKDILSIVLEMDPKQFDKYASNLWCHGLITFQDVVFPNAIIKVPCIEIHEVIAQYVTENMPDEYYGKVPSKTLHVFRKIFFNEYFKFEGTTNIGLYHLHCTDGMLLPLLIRSMILCAKCIQIDYFKSLNSLIEQNIYLLQNNDLKKFIHNNQLPRMKYIHRTIEQDCKSIHSLLVDGKYNEAITWAEQYFDVHPWKLTLEIIIANYNTLLNSCKNNLNHKVILTIEDYISHYNQKLIHFNKCQKFIKLEVIGYGHVICLMKAGASDDDIKHYLICSTLATC